MIHLLIQQPYLKPTMPRLLTLLACLSGATAMAINAREVLGLTPVGCQNGIAFCGQPPADDDEDGGGGTGVGYGTLSSKCERTSNTDSSRQASFSTLCRNLTHVDGARLRFVVRAM